MNDKIVIEIAPDRYDDGRETLYGGVVIQEYSNVAYVDASADSIELLLMKLVERLAEAVLELERKDGHVPLAR